MNADLSNSLSIAANQHGRKVLIIGDDPIIEDIDVIIRGNGQNGVVHLPLKKFYAEYLKAESPTKPTAGARFHDIVLGREFKKIVLAGDLFPAIGKQILQMRFSGTPVYDAVQFYETLTGRVPSSHVQVRWLLLHSHTGMRHPTAYKITKEVFDRLLALLGIVLTLPLILIIASLVRLSSKGPVIFKQERLGQGEEPFMLFKFRTMVENAEMESGPKWAGENDPRITWVGRILRKNRLDELPQLFNILKGDMSLCGPRPIRKCFADMLENHIPYYRLRFSVKPGLTGWAQVQGGYAGSIEGQREKHEYDLHYLLRRSILFDLRIILKTVWTVLSRRGQ